MVFDKELNAEIVRLKELSILKDRTEYLKMKKEIMARRRISDATVWREMKKETPGLYKSRQFRGNKRRKVTDDEIAYTRELLELGLRPYQVRQKLEKHFGKPYCWDFFGRIRKELESRVKTGDEVKDPLVATRHSPFVRGRQESSGQSNLRNLIEEFYDLDMKLPENGIEVSCMDRKVIIPKEECSEICRIIANVMNRQGLNKFGISRNELMRQRLFHLIEERISQLQNDFPSSRELDSLIRNYKQLYDAPEEWGINFKILWYSLREFKPNLSAEDALGIATKFKHLYVKPD